MQNIDHWLKWAISYIDTISAGEELEKSQIALEGYFNRNEMELAANAYHNQSELIRRQADYLNQPYEEKSRETILEQDNKIAESSVQNSIYLISVYEEIKKLNENMQDQDLEEMENSRKLIEAGLPLIQQDRVREMLRQNYEIVPDGV